MTKVRVRRIGNSLGLIIPNDVCIRESIKEGSTLDLVEDGKGGFHVTRLEPALARQIEVAERILEEEDGVLRALALR